MVFRVLDNLKNVKNNNKNWDYDKGKKYEIKRNCHYSSFSRKKKNI